MERAPNYVIASLLEVHLLHLSSFTHIFHQSSLIPRTVSISFCWGGIIFVLKIPGLIPKSLCYSETGVVCTVWHVWQIEEHENLKVTHCLVWGKQNSVIYISVRIRSANPEYTPLPLPLCLRLTLWRWVICCTQSYTLLRAGLEEVMSGVYEVGKSQGITSTRWDVALDMEACLCVFAYIGCENVLLNL